MDLQQVKQRFGIIGNSTALNHALEISIRVAPTNLTVLITGESGVGKEAFSQIIHQLSPRKHEGFIAVNCGAIPEGTIDSELFGHEKGSFTGAHEKRKGYFETVDGGTIFLDEIGEMPLGTQARLLRVLEAGEFIKVGSSNPQKTDVRVVAATNVDLPDLIDKGKFREDLYYRLSTVPIQVPPLRERGDDVLLLFRKFALDFAEKNRSKPVRLSDEAQQLLMKYDWPGNVRQLKNIAEQVSVLARDTEVGIDELAQFIPDIKRSKLPMVFNQESSGRDNFSERELLYKLLFEMKKDINDLKQYVLHLSQHGEMGHGMESNLTPAYDYPTKSPVSGAEGPIILGKPESHEDEHAETVEENLSLADKEKELISRALKKHRGKRKDAAAELGISERTLYRKIKEYQIKE
jgi:DNA-binding NtrC family response regulator